MIVTDDQVVAGFVALSAAITGLSGAVVYLYRQHRTCQEKLAKLSSDFELILQALGDPPPKRRRRHKSGEHPKLP